MDADDDGVSNDAVQNTGTIYALMTASQFAAGNFVVSAITDIAYQYTKNLIGETDSSWLKTRLDDLAKNFFIADLNGDSVIDSKDLLAFIPTDANHKSKLNFDYQILFTPDENGNSIIDSYHQNLEDMLLSLLEKKFGSRISLLASTDTRYQKVKVEVSVFGDGSVKSDIGGIDVDSERENPADDVVYAFFDQSSTGKVILTATPTSETEILLWTGCDKVSDDKTQCECSLKDNYLVSVYFEYKETMLQDGITLVDLSNANVVLSDDMVTLDVTAGEGDTDMVAKLAALKAGDVVVGSADLGFLRRVISIEKLSDSNYILTTGDIALEDVIAQGTGVFNKDMTNEDLIPDDTSATRSARGYVPGVQAAEGVRFIPSDKPNDPVFRFLIGESNTRSGVSKTISWTDPNTGITAEIAGSIDVSVNVDFGVSFKWFSIEEFRFIPTLKATESLKADVRGKLDYKWEKEIGVLNFTTIIFMVGPVPVVIVPQIRFYLGIEAKAGGQIVTSIILRQTATAGIQYKKKGGFKTVSGFSSTYDFVPPTVTAYAELVPYARVFPTLRLYGVTGPAIDAKGYLKLRGDLNLSVPYSDKPCIDSLLIAAYWGMKVNFVWDLGPLKKILGKLASSNPSTPIYSKEELIRKWDFCINQAPFMEVQGSDILKIVYLKSGEVVSTTYTVKNSGDTTMNWTASASADGITSVTPTSGSLAKGQSTTVTVSVNTGNISSVSTYKNTVAFKNLYVDKNTSQANNGSANRNISVNVVPKLAVPVMNTPQIATGSNGSPIPSIVNLSWSYPDAETLGYVGGYYIYKDGVLIATLTKPDSAYQVANLSPGVTYSFQVKAYGNNTIGDLSNIVSIKTPCIYNISPASQSLGVSGGSGIVNITISGGCSWTITSNASWITITSGSTGTGNGTVSYSVLANTDANSRTGTLTIAGQTFSVLQAGKESLRLIWDKGNWDSRNWN
ncbi:MAG: hypothetical protein BWK80_58105 [Desulfobacteraceae bacterium IS3]|nr:MAG: hypothetical protein BWK80_58105 [Desulfobacteraceae bacterium IS3]